MRTRNPEQRAKNVTSAISTVRSIKNEFNMTELVIALKTANCPYPGEVASLLKKKNYITKRNGTYYFSSPEPVYYKTILNDLEEIYLKYKPKSKNETNFVKKGKVVKVQLTIEEAISYLKSQGFKVMKPVTQYEEV